MNVLTGDLALRLALTLLLLVTAVWDFRTRRIPNVLTLPGLVLALGAQFAIGGPGGLWQSLAGFGIGLGFFFIPFALGKLGAGDVKLMAVAGAVLGPVDTVNALLLVSLAGGVYALGVIAWNALTPALESGGFMTRAGLLAGELAAVCSPAGRKEKIKMCYGLAIAAGVICQMGLTQAGIAPLVSF